MLIDLLFPKTCIGCFRELRSGALCERCHKTLPRQTAPQCPHCDRRLPRGIVNDACRTALDIQRLAIGGPYAHPMLRAAIDALKYDGIRDLSESLGTILAEMLQSFGVTKDMILVPIPLHERRLRERGYNQSALLARVAATRLSLPYDETILSRRRATAQQAKLTRDRREENVRDAFFVQHSERLDHNAVILIDDVITTGATIREAAKALRRAGAKAIWAAAVAQG